MSVGLSVDADGVAEIRLERAEMGNALDLDMIRGLGAAALECACRRDVRAILLSGEGDAFCAGGDLTYIGAEPARAEPVLRELADEMHVAVRRLTSAPQPVVVAVNGPTAGVGLSVVCLADIVLAAETAWFKVAYTAIGLCPDGGSSWMLPRIVGLRAAAELMLTNRRFDAEEGRRMGLVSRVLPGAELAGVARAVATEIARGSLAANAAVKRLLLSSMGTSLGEQLDREAELLAELGGGEDGREGIAAFLAKRPPRFVGAS